MRQAWRDDALCAQVGDVVLFFPEEPGSRATEAKRICNACPVVADCLDWALNNNELGVWGGTTESQRRMIRRNYRRGDKAS